MWRILLTICLITLLSACSVSIDPETEEKLPVDQSSQNGVTIISDIAPKIEDEISRTERIKEIISDVFHLDWEDLKDEYAQDIFYLALGDSLTRGVGDEKQDYGYTVRLQKQLEQWSMIKSVELDNRGKNGRRSNQLLALLKKGHYDEELAKANLVTITLGGNDVMKIVKNNLFTMEQSMFDKELPKFINRYDEILQEIRLRNADVPIILIGFYNPMSIVVDEVTPFESIISEWNTEIDNLSLAYNNVCFVPVEDLFVSNEDMVYHVDFFHPNSTGYDRMAERVIETMQSCDIESMSNGLLGFGE
ncbi:GDSL-type esterase/lipase family protein [Solibacillus sp. MA9]|uniref:GDSL-type esterase/lipase family protein n=1 Tax=Solibacillus palustris TaxID=2908203 RepID=A0ABS9UES6_9BACL|nr:GDSL-type esterase/lipase family protein [Solibacillus sp. MA9]MCH7322599.1 GDSL-type esterase/lipase family protein [Solibacillus sp. MA9]